VDETNHVALKTVETTSTVEKIHEGSGWFTVSVTMWPLVVLAICLLFRKQLTSLLADLSGITFGSFSLKLRRRILKFADEEQYEKIKRLSAHDLKYFFIVASQSWKIDKVDWRTDPQTNREMHSRLENAGLITISPRDRAIAPKWVVCYK